jgi:hypothetical protein
MLVSILNKALASITAEEKFTIRQTWVPVVDTSAPQTAAPVFYRRLVIYGIAVFLTLCLLTWVLIRSIRRETIAVRFGSSWFRGLVLAGLSVFVLVVAFLGWYMLERYKTEHLLDVDENLQGILSVSEDRFALWLEEALESALDTVGLTASSEHKAGKPSGVKAVLPEEIRVPLVKRLREAADIGDIGGLNAIADELLAMGDVFEPLSRSIAGLAGNFDFEGVGQLADTLEDPDGVPQ